MQALLIRKAEIALRKGNNEIQSSESRSKSRAQKLWKGHIRLNSSVTVSVVAFFKSGEKMPDARWSEDVEVKGKVKLDDFETYIQELSCSSKTRGMMVTSLCWNEVSSKCGLAGMKMVAYDYKKDKKVGLAQISEGIHLYICPRTDAIITILAKHGFFKGMSAIEENQDSLIGCVVWRRRGASVFTQKPESKVKEQCPDAVAKDCSTPESVSSDGLEDKIKNVRKSVDQLKLKNSLAGSNFLEAPSLLTKSTHTESPENSGSVECSQAPPTQKLGIEKPEPTSLIQNSEDKNVEKFVDKLKLQNSPVSGDFLQIPSVLIKSAPTASPKNTGPMGNFPEAPPTEELESEKQNSLASSNILEKPSELTKSTPTASPKSVEPVGQFSEAPPTEKLGIENPKLSPEITKPVLPLSPVFETNQFTGKFSDQIKLQSASSDFLQTPSVLTQSTSMVQCSEAPSTQTCKLEKPEPISGIKNVQNSSVSSDILQTPSVLTKSTSVGRSSEAPPTQTFGLDKPKPISGIQNTVFDIGQAQNKSQTIGANINDNFYPPVPLRAVSLDSIPTLYKRKLENVVHPSFSNDAFLKLPRLVEVGHHIEQSRSLVRLYGAASGPNFENHFDKYNHVWAPQPNPTLLGISQPGAAPGPVSENPFVGDKPACVPPELAFHGISHSRAASGPIISENLFVRNKPAWVPPEPAFHGISHSRAASGPIISENPFVGDKPAWVPPEPAFYGISHSRAASGPSPIISENPFAGDKPAWTPPESTTLGISQSTPPAFVPPRQRPISALGNLYPGHPNLVAYQDTRPLSESFIHGHKQVWGPPEPTLHGISQLHPATFTPSQLPQQSPYQAFSPRPFNHVGPHPSNFSEIPTRPRPGNEFVQMNPSPQMMFHANSPVPPPPTHPFNLGPPRNPYGSRPLW